MKDAPKWHRDPVAQRIRERRLARGLSLQQLAERAGVRAPSHIYHIESGEKAPSEGVAIRLAQALEDDPTLYRAWAHARGRSDLGTTLMAAATLRRLLPGSTLEATAAGEAPRDDSRAAPARIRIPLLAEGADPGDGRHPRGGAIEMLRVDVRLLTSMDDLDRPFAYRASALAVVRIAPAIQAGDIVVLSRRFLPLDPEAMYALRFQERIGFGRVLWNRGLLLVLPGHGRDDFELLEANDEEALSVHIVGKVAAVVPG